MNQQFETQQVLTPLRILKFVRLAPNSIFQCHNLKGIKHLTGLRLSFSHPRDHKIKHSFQDTINLLCTFSLEAETTNHFILHCPYYYVVEIGCSISFAFCGNYNKFKGQTQFSFLCNSYKSDASWSCISFSQINKNVWTTETYLWLELMTLILIFLKVFSFKETSSHFSLIFWKIFKEITPYNGYILNVKNKHTARGIKIERFWPATTKMNMGKNRRSIRLDSAF